MSMIVHMMASGAKPKFSQEEYREIVQEADILFKELSNENRHLPKALKKHTGTNIFPAIAVYKTMVAHGMEAEEATDVIRRFFSKLCRVIFTPVSWYQHICGN